MTAAWVNAADWQIAAEKRRERALSVLSHGKGRSEPLPDEEAPVAWCCAHYPTTCGTHGLTDTAPQATVAAIDHWKEVHR